MMIITKKLIDNIDFIIVTFLSFHIFIHVIIEKTDIMKIKSFLFIDKSCIIF